MKTPLPLVRGVAAALVAAVLALPARGSDVLVASSFDYFYIEANEGNSSGGHVALRLGPWVYHFQNRDGLLVLLRERVDEFLYSYALLSNRTIHSSRVAVSAETRERIERNFERRRRAQVAQLGVLEALRDDRALLTASQDGAEETPVPGLGYFRTQAPVVGDRSRTLLGLHERIAVAHGRTFLAERRQAVIAGLEHLHGEDPAGWQIEPPVSATDRPPFSRPYSARFADLAAALSALTVLDQARLLDPAALHQPVGAEFDLAPDEAVALLRYGRKLEQQLVALVNSPRPDWGGAFLIGMARLAAIERSFSAGRWVGLDSFPEDGHRLTHAMLARRPEIVPMMLAETRQQFDDFRRYVARQPQISELEWERTEERFNRYAELHSAMQGARDVRVASGHLLPERLGRFAMPSLESRKFGDDLPRVRARERAYAKRVGHLYHYGLITHNCVTAIFETLNESIPGSRAEVEIQLGGWVDGINSLTFIPFVSADRVNELYRVVERSTISSFRQARLQEIRQREDGFWVELRESNTFSSTTYQRGHRDSFFIFFTEDAPLLRPLFGTANLAAAFAESLWGFARLPLDRGATLMSGVKGAFVSLPELVFVNIRKGSNDWIPQEFRDVSVDGPSPRS